MLSVKRPIALTLAGAAVLIVVVLRGALEPSADRLPGIDSANIHGWEVYTRAALAEGTLPFWNPYHFSGSPHLADLQTTVFYPPALLLRWLPVPAFLGWMIALHLLIAAGGTLFAARVLGLGWLAGAAAAAAVMLGGSVAGWIHNGHLLLLYSVAWVPWAFGFAIASVRSGRTVPDGRLVAVLALNFLSGYLQGTLYLGAAVAAYFVFAALWPDRSTVRSPRWRPLAQLAILAVLTGAAAAFQLLPTVTLVAEAGRSAGLPYEDAIDGRWALADLATLVFPFYGSSGEVPYRNLPDRLAYVGWMLMAFAPFALFDRERRRISVFLAVLSCTAIGFVLAEALPLYRLHHALFPGLRVPGRMLFLATFGFALLGAIGLHAFLSLAAARRWRPLAAGTAVTLGGAALAFARAFGPQTGAALAPGWPWLPMLLAGSLLVVAFAGLFGWRKVALVTAMMAVVVDVTALSARAMETVPIETASTIRRWIGPPGVGRAISTCENRIGPHEFLLNRQPTLDGLPALHLRDYGDWAYLARTGEVPPGDGLYRRVGSERERPARQDLVAMAGVSRIVSCEESGDDGTTNTGVVVRAAEHAWPRAVWVCAAEEVSRRRVIARLVQGRYTSDGYLHPRHHIKVVWTANVDEPLRATLEKTYRLEDGVELEEGPWRYVLGDDTPAAVVAIMRDPNVADTHGVDRHTGAVALPADLENAVAALPGDDELRYALVGTEPCAAAAEVSVDGVDRPDGHLTAQVDAPVDGFVFLSEAHYPERHAYLDGRRVPALKANLAFTAVAVPSGRHQLELRYEPTSFYLGSLISGATGAGYAGFVLIRRRRPR